jgi:hypothetical protein
MTSEVPYSLRLTYRENEPVVAFITDGVHHTAYVTFSEGKADNVGGQKPFIEALGVDRLLREAQNFFDEYAGV